MKIPVLHTWERKIRHHFKQKKTRREAIQKIGQYKYVHVMNNGIHSMTIIRFINKYFDNNEHCFIFPILKEETKPKIKGIKNVFPYNLTYISADKVQKVIFHGLFTTPPIQYLYKHRDLLAKSYWYIWGGDFYNVKDTAESSFVRKNFAGILTAFDYPAYKKKYGANKWFDVSYPHDDAIHRFHPCQKSGDVTRILINNCADETTLSMMESLARFAEENIEIYTILSYISANQRDVRLEIMKRGYETFGKKFKPLISFIPTDKYFEFLTSVDIYISNQNRQQGNGNATIVCSSGGKVFTKSDTGVYTRYNELGIRYFDTYSIPNLSFQELISYAPDVREQTIHRLKERMKDSTKVEQWKRFFETI